MTAPSSPEIDFGHARYLLRVGALTLPVRRRSLLVATGLVTVILALAVLALGLGTYTLTPDQVVRALLGQSTGLDRTVVLEWRLPRTLAAVVIGGALGIAGALFQTVTRNPLASPDVLGLGNGAFTGMLTAVVIGATSWSLLTLGAVLGGTAAAAVIWLLASRNGVTGFRLIIVGIGVSALLSSVNTWLLLQVELDTAMFASAWGAGSLNGVGATAVRGAALCTLPLLVLLAFAIPRLRQMDLGDDAATALGARPGTARRTVLIIGVALVSIGTAVAGPVAFIALAAPQIARRLARTPYLSLMLSALAGAVLLLASDVIAQHVLPIALPVGVVTVSVGGLYLITMIIREIRR
ncbi:FecCD family ABC transporter permease [Actinoplanes couchii]|uniref:Iron-enterobactin transporter permease n=1 Tax=Actinoplanes couchii TaxID=403638 RepID=A0ABQ3XGL9_9ACTN|nr:iron chelate uptake ABC transporter family permease subunit [Actinoplanes couchii]MDR6321127.1 iron complex transport system permease protein [Actinoplanes couchii]GID57640.1 iron-enterobactin transporter permease [Actinoplanes couchii]